MGAWNLHDAAGMQGAWLIAKLSRPCRPWAGTTIVLSARPGLHGYGRALLRRTARGRIHVRQSRNSAAVKCIMQMLMGRDRDGDGI